MKNDKRGFVLILGLMMGVVVILLALALAPSLRDTTSFTMDNNRSSLDELHNVITGKSCYVSGWVNESSPDCNITVNYPPSLNYLTNGGCPISNVIVENKGGTLLTNGTDYILYTERGIISLKNTTLTSLLNSSGEFYISYYYCDEEALNCDDPLISQQDKAVCTSIDLQNIFIALLIGIGGMIIVRHI